MRRTLTFARSFAVATTMTVLTVPVPVLSQTVTRDGTPAQPAGRVSKVDALTIKQSGAAAGYLKIGDIKGESTDKKHKGEIDILSWSWGTSRTASRTPPQGSGTLTITKSVDASSPALADASRSRRRFQWVTLTLPPSRAGEAEMVVTLADVTVGSVERSSDGSRPTESVSFNFTKIK